jgi:hypothetical protein
MMRSAASRPHQDREDSLLEEVLDLLRDCHARSGRLSVAQIVHEAVAPLVENALRWTADEDLCRALRALREGLPPVGFSGKQAEERVRENALPGGAGTGP